MGKLARIIGVSGAMRTGKDSVAALLQRFGYTRVSFADPLRKMAKDIDPYILIDDPKTPAAVHDQVHAAGIGEIARYSEIIDKLGYEKAKEIPDFRRYLQRLGTEGVRGNFGANAWVDLAVKAINDLPVGARVVMPDVRFPNEAQAIRDLGGVIWRTVRPGFGGGDHPSEAMVEKIEPDVILEADNLIDLGVLVLREADLEGFGEILPDWADSILTAS